VVKGIEGVISGFSLLHLPYEPFNQIKYGCNRILVAQRQWILPIIEFLCISYRPALMFFQQGKHFFTVFQIWLFQ
jgi:hypothetical protein